VWVVKIIKGEEISKMKIDGIDNKSIDALHTSTEWTQLDRKRRGCRGNVKANKQCFIYINFKSVRNRNLEVFKVKNEWNAYVKVIMMILIRIWRSLNVAYGNTELR